MKRQRDRKLGSKCLKEIHEIAHVYFTVQQQIDRQLVIKQDRKIYEKIERQKTRK